MLDDEPYDLLPHRQINELKGQIEELKAKQDKNSPKELINSMDTLAKSIESLMNLFKQAAQELKYEIKEEELAAGKDSVHEKLDKIIEQNKIIANGMVAISDTVKDFTGKQKKVQPKSGIQPQNYQQPIPMPQQTFQLQNQLPPLDVPLPGFEDTEKKKGLFGMFKK